MYIQKTICISALLLMCAFSAHYAYADDDTGFYVGAAVNRLSADFKDESDVNFDDSDTAASARAGYMISDFFGVEIGYLDLGNYFAEGDNAGNRIDLDADAYSLAAVFNWSIMDELDLYTKAGVFQLNVDSNSIIAGSRLRNDQEETEPFGTFGAEFDLGQLNFFAEITVADTDINDLSINIATAGIKYEFGAN